VNEFRDNVINETLKLNSKTTYENASTDHGCKVAGNRQKIPNAKLRFMHRSAEDVLYAIYSYKLRKIYPSCTARDKIALLSHTHSHFSQPQCSQHQRRLVKLRYCNFDVVMVSCRIIIITSHHITWRRQKH